MTRSPGGGPAKRSWMDGHPVLRVLATATVAEALTFVLFRWAYGHSPDVLTPATLLLILHEPATIIGTDLFAMLPHVAGRSDLRLWEGCVFAAGWLMWVLAISLRTTYRLVRRADVDHA